MFGSQWILNFNPNPRNGFQGSGFRQAAQTKLWLTRLAMACQTNLSSESVQQWNLFSRLVPSDDSMRGKHHSPFALYNMLPICTSNSDSNLNINIGHCRTFCPCFSLSAVHIKSRHPLIQQKAIIATQQARKPSVLRLPRFVYNSDSSLRQLITMTIHTILMEDKSLTVMWPCSRQQHIQTPCKSTKTARYPHKRPGSQTEQQEHGNPQAHTRQITQASLGQ
jgi:hypothetical protein